MSNYGADEDPSIPAAQDLAWTKRFLPFVKANVMQWTYAGNKVVRKLAHRLTGSNVLFKLDDEPPPPVIPPDLPPVAAGNQCANCWGNGEPFGVGETPESITVVIQDVEKGPAWMPGNGEPPNGTFILEQSPVVACWFNFVNVDYSMTLRFFPALTRFNVTQMPIAVLSFNSVTGPCDTTHENGVIAQFIGGTATLFIPPIL